MCTGIYAVKQESFWEWNRLQKDVNGKLMKDGFGRNIDYLRISVTDRCNLRCKYCMPEGGVQSLPMSELLTYEEVTEVCKIASDLGIRKIRLTGGEPLVRLELPKLVRMIRTIPGIESIAMTTNGILLKDCLDELVDSGLDGVNISLDTLDRDTFRHITGQDAFDKVMTGIQESLDAGLRVKVNTVLLPHQFYLHEGDSWKSMLPLARELPVDLRFIELMPIGEGKQFYQITGEEVLGELRKEYPSVADDHTVHGSGPAVYYKIQGFAGTIGLIQAMHGKFCYHCNRIRLSATGRIKPCLCYSDTYDIQYLVRERRLEEIKKTMEKAILAKPAAHCFEELSQISENHKMVSIGG